MADQKTPAPVKGAHNEFANSLLENAQILADERDQLLAQTTANRTMLRSMRTQEMMSTEQAAAVEAFYPTRTKKPKATAAA